MRSWRAGPWLAQRLTAAPRPVVHARAARAARRIQTLQTLQPADQPASARPTNPPLVFPCLDAIESRSAHLARRPVAGPEPSYNVGAHQRFASQEPLLLDWGGVLPGFDVAFESWGSLNAAADNAVLLHTGLSASSHAHSTDANPQPGWWEAFIGPGRALDTDRFCVICTNVVGGCYGSTGPASIDPAIGERYATRFPILTMEDMVRAQFRLLDGLGVGRLYASVGASMGAMQSLAAGVLFPDRVSRIVSISGCARTHPYSIAIRYTQRQVLMMDPHWARGYYYDGVPPHSGMKLAREIATVTYRSGPEWDHRFGRRRADPSKPPALCPDFLIETYLDHAGEKWCLEYDANSLLYLSKAMDLFDLGHAHRKEMMQLRQRNESKLVRSNGQFRKDSELDSLCSLSLPEQAYSEREGADSELPVTPGESRPPYLSRDPPEDLVAGMEILKDIPTLVLGVASDILFPAWQQREIAESLTKAGNRRVTHVELGEDKSLFGHDTFLLDVDGVGGSVKRFMQD